MANKPDTDAFLKSLVGLSKKKAMSMIRNRVDLECRVWYKWSLGTMDIRENRVNLYVDEEIVTGAYLG